MIRSRILPVLAVLVAGLGLSACGNSQELRVGGMSETMEATRGVFARRSAPVERLQPTPGFPGLDPALIAGQTVPLLGAYLEQHDTLAGLHAVGSSGGVVSWRSADNVGLALAGGGILISSRGLGSDLHAADVGQTAALVAAGRAGTAQRRHAYLDGVYRERIVTLACTVQPAGPEVLVLNGRSLRTLRIDEHCTGGGYDFVNRFWRDAGGPLIRQSTQWIGPEAGTIHLQRLVE